MIPKRAQEILDFWFKETPTEKRFKKEGRKPAKNIEYISLDIILIFTTRTFFL